jgi:hypothetical protein
MVTSVCLTVLGIIGQFCYGPASPIGECVEMNYSQYACTVEADELPLFVSVYDYAICDEHPINCFNGGTHFANGIPTGPEWYEVAAACPHAWVGSYLSVPAVYDYPLYCVDTGGRIHPMFREVWVFDRVSGQAEKVWMWVIMLDILYPYHLYGWPGYALQAYSDWQRIVTP